MPEEVMLLSIKRMFTVKKFLQVILYKSLNLNKKEMERERERAVGECKRHDPLYG